MKLLTRISLLVLCLGGISSAASVPTTLEEARADTINDLVIGFIEQFKQIMPCGIPDLGVPVLVPFELEHTEFGFEQSGLLQVETELNDIFVDDLNNFDIVKIDVKLLQLQVDFGFFFHSIKSTGQYKAKGTVLGLIPFNRGGKFAFNVNGLSLEGSIKIGIEGENVFIKEFKLRPIVNSVDSKFENVFILPLNTFIFNKVVEAVIPNFLRDNQEQVTQFLEDALVPQVNGLLGEFTLDDLMGMVTGNSSLPTEC
ncbi:uncharacterized protein LOC129751908 [Uranotaenia lowii]|uniref:uncharacterized protein LOC129751908 n=1 Tax=Uranotaenia lowii TaxID=190385 RepID=UPI00247A3ED0|nr:uncharacterized protein LOC129751908 [Uranotaenia lowii]